MVRFYLRGLKACDTSPFAKQASHRWFGTVGISSILPRAGEVLYAAFRTVGALGYYKDKQVSPPKVLPVGLPEPGIDRRLLSPTGPSFEHPKSFSTVFSWLH